MYLVVVAETALFQLLDVVLIEAHHHVLIVAVEYHTLSRAAVFQYHALCARLIVAFLFSFYDNFIYSSHSYVERVFAVALHVVVVDVCAAVSQVDVILHISAPGRAIFGFLISAFQYHVCTIVRGIGECLLGGLVVILTSVPVRYCFLGSLQILWQIDLEELGSILHVIDTANETSDATETLGIFHFSFCVAVD